MKRVNKRELSRRASKGLKKKYSIIVIGEILDELIRQINLAMINGERVEIRFFGSFFIRILRNKACRNPKTGVALPNIPIFKKVMFRSSEKMKERLNAKNSK